MINCLMPSIVEKIRSDFKAGKINLYSLQKMSDKQQIDFWAKYGVPEDFSKKMVAKMEKIVFSPRLNTALKNYARRVVMQRGELYSSIEIDSAERLSKNYTISQIVNMDSKERIKTLSEYLLKENSSKSDKTKAAERLSKIIDNYKKNKNFETLERKLFGTDLLSRNKRIKGELAKIDKLAQQGLLSPKNIDDYAQSLVEQELGVGVSADEAKKLADFSAEAVAAYEEVGDNFTATTEGQKEKIEDFMVKRAKLARYTQFLENGKTVENTANNIISIFRNNFLGSPKSLVNSAKYQVVPSLTRIITKRFNVSDKSTQITNLSDIGINKSLLSDVSLEKFIKNQVNLELSVYNKTSEDLARMTNLEDGFSLFSEYTRGEVPLLNLSEKDKQIAKERKAILKELRLEELQGIETLVREKYKDKDEKFIKSKIKQAQFSQKGKYLVQGYTNFTGTFPKWFAGYTDVLVAAATRADTTLFMANKRANFEEKNNLLPSGLTKEERIKQLVIDSYSFSPKDQRAQIIRESSLSDAHYSNSTQESGVADLLSAIRGKFKVGEVKLGNLFTPFLRIGATAQMENIKSALTPIVNVAYALDKIKKASNNPNLSEAQKTIIARKEIAKAVTYTGAWVVAFLIAYGLDDDDYVPPYDLLGSNQAEKSNRYKLIREKGANTNSIKLFGKWYGLDYLPFINIPLSSMMVAKEQYKKDGDIFNSGFAYLKGLVAASIDLPFVSEIRDWGANINKFLGSGGTSDFASKTGLSFDSFWRQTMQRVAPAFFSRDLVNMFAPADYKYDFLGNEIKLSQSDNPINHIVNYYLGLRDVKKGNIAVEFSRLEKAGYLPTISDPSTKYAKALESMLSEKEYIQFLNGVKQEYGKQVEKLIESSKYQKLSDEEKSKEIDNIRSKLMSGNSYKDNEFLGKIKSILTQEEWINFKKQNKI